MRVPGGLEECGGASSACTFWRAEACPLRVSGRKDDAASVERRAMHGIRLKVAIYGLLSRCITNV